MNGHNGEARQTPNTSQRPPGARRAESVVFWLMLVVAIVLTTVLRVYLPRSPQERLAYGVITFALAVVATLLVPLINKIPVGLARYVLGWVDVLLRVPSIFGSVLLVDILFEGAGYHVAVFVVVMAGLCLWVLLFLPLAALAGRAATRA